MCNLTDAFQFAGLTICSLFITVLVGLKYFNNKSSSNSVNNGNNNTKKTQKKKSKFFEKYDPKFESIKDVSTQLKKINIKSESLDFEKWIQFYKQFEDKRERELFLTCLEDLVLKLTNKNRVKRMKKQQKKLKEKAKNVYKYKNYKKAKRELANYKKLIGKCNENDKKICEFIDINGIFVKNNIKFQLSLNFRKELSLKHAEYLWENLKKTVEDNDDINCVVCQYNIHDDAYIKLNCCGINIHYECQIDYINSYVNKKGIKINLNNLGCMVCKKQLKHKDVFVNKSFNDINILYNKLVDSYKKRLKFEDKTEDNINYAIKKYIYYKCYKCSEPYFGGLNNCQDMNHNKVNPNQRLCSKCQPIKGYEKNCKIHAGTFIQWKCKFCCSVATWDCGCTHFCELCHHKACELWDMKKEDLLQCPCVSDKKTYMPKKIDLKTCPLNINHPAHGEEYCLGCAECIRIRNEKKNNDDRNESKSESNNDEIKNDLNDDSEIGDNNINNEPQYNIDNDDDYSDDESIDMKPNWLKGMNDDSDSDNGIRDDISIHNDNNNNNNIDFGDVNRNDNNVPNWLAGMNNDSDDSSIDEYYAINAYYDVNDHDIYNNVNNILPNWVMDMNGDSDTEYSEDNNDNKPANWLMLENDNNKLPDLLIDMNDE